jgi:hypothetical protein
MLKVLGIPYFFANNNIVFHRRDTESQFNEVTLNFVDANPYTAVEGVDEQPGKTNFYKGSNPSNWYTDIQSFSTVKYTNLYAGVDMAYLGANGKLKSEFYVAAGADYRQIRLNYKGIESKIIRDDGTLILKSRFGEIIEEDPIVYQEFNGDKRYLDAVYIIHGGETVGFKVEDYDSSLPMVIDPEFSYASYLGGNNYSIAAGIAIDSSGHILVAGRTRATDFPVQNALQENNAGGYDAFVSKIDTANGTFIYSTYLGGALGEVVSDLKIDSTGNAYIVGNTQSSDFPVTENALQPVKNGFGTDAFISKFSPNGILLYSTFLGGGKDENDMWGIDEIKKIALGPNGEMYIAGKTTTIDFPLSAAIQPQLNGNSDAFMAKLNPVGDALVYSTYFGGSGPDEATGIGIDDDGNVYIGGTTESTDLQTVSAVQDSLKGDKDVFITKLNSAGDEIIYSTYFGGVASDQAYDIAVDSAGNTYIVGRTFSDDFPIKSGTLNKISTGNGRSINAPMLEASDGFFAMFDPLGLFQYSELTLLANTDYFTAVALIKLASYNHIITGGYVENNLIMFIYVNENGEISLDRIDDYQKPGYHHLKDITTIDGNMAVAMGTDHLWEVTENAVGEFHDSGSDEIYVWFKEEGAVLDADIYITDENGVPPDSILLGTIYHININVTNIGKVRATEVIGLMGGGRLFDRVLSIPQGWELISRGTFRSFFITLESGESREYDFKFFALKNDKNSPNIYKQLNYYGDNTNTVEKTIDYGIKVFGSVNGILLANILLPENTNENNSLQKLITNKFIDIYIDSVLVFDDLSGNLLQPKEFELYSAEPIIDITSSDAANNSNPLASFEKDLTIGKGEDIFLPDNFGFMFMEVEPDSFKMLLKKDLHIKASDSSKVDLFITHAASNAGSIDLRLVDENEPPGVIQTLYDNIEPDSVTEYVSLSPDNHSIQITTADNSQQFDIFKFDLTEYIGDALFGSIVPDSQQTTAVFLLYDSEGNNIEEGTSTAVEDQDYVLIPKEYNLEQNYPNPFNPSTTISYSIPAYSLVTLKVYDVLGKEVATLINEKKSAGIYKANFNAEGLTSGIYFYKLHGGSFVKTLKMVLLK